MANQKTLKNFIVGEEYEWTELKELGDYVGSFHELSFENVNIHQSVIVIEENNETAVFIYTSVVSVYYYYQCIFNTTQKMLE